MNIEQNNKLIAEFMGYKPRYISTGYEWNETKYHSSWDWLMPVVKKILFEGKSINIRTLKHALIEVHKEAVYNAVVEFIKWYNKK